MSTQLPVSDAAAVRRRSRALVRRHRGGLALVLGLNAAAAVAGLVGPWLLGDLVQAVVDGTTRGHVDAVMLVLGGAVLLQTVLTRAARRHSFVLSERVFAELRESFMGRVLGLPLSTVERAGTGDLVSRTTADVDALARTVRFAVPETLVAVVTSVLTVLAALVVSPLVSLPVLVAVPMIWVSTRWYLRRAPAGYLWERAAYARITGGVAETADGARTVEALGLGDARIRRTDEDIAESYRAERRTLFLRSVWFPTLEVAYFLPIAGALLWGGWLALDGRASIAQVTTVTLYLWQLVEPVDQLLMWLDELQVGAAAYARIIGVDDVPDDRSPSGAEPRDAHVVARDVRYAYAPGRDVLHGIDLDLRPGERLAVVGPSGAGKSTFGRLLAGVHPPRTGAVSVGGVPLVDLTLDGLRREVALVTQEHHVFVGTLADNVRLARPDASDAELAAALDAVDALGWARSLDDGLSTVVGAGGHPLTPAQAQQVALARLVLADPHTLVLDEATSLLDPRAARHLERSLGAVLDGRTVVAIAHRLHTAHDADRVAVMEDGRIAELGTHEELVAAGGAYAALWQSWHGSSASVSAPATDAGGALTPTR